MKEKLTRNIGVKILSLLLATILWLVITNVNDPVQYKTFSDMQVTIKNESMVKNSKQSYEILEGEVVDFKVAARRSIIQNLKEYDFDVVADFDNLSIANSVEIEIVPKKHKEDIEIVDRGEVKYLKISIEELSGKDFKVNVVDVGKVEEGYYLGPRFASPNIIRVDGPKSRIEKIKQVIVKANVEGASNTVRQISEPLALDEEGNVIDATRLNFSHRYVEAGIELYQIKEIPLKITTTGQPAEGYIMTGIDYQPKTIEIAAEESKLKNINLLEVTADIGGASENIEEFLELQEWLDEGVYLVAADTTASVNITIEKLESKEVSIWPVDIELKNKSERMDAIYVTKGPIKVIVWGPNSDITAINRNTLKPFINLYGYLPGTYNMDLQADLPKNIFMDIDTPDVIINLVLQP
ncbi:MAG: hypothetical protein GX319_05110 [Clostridiales bacterium]|jgi:YbbR domain-containing protein|nr:CdaR family protein [Bacillota bacterium]NLK03772.1 hypothetical protein [Clostridiales bacterium]